jgi:hypothetical protein
VPRYHIEVRTESHVATTLDVDRDDVESLRVEMARFVGQLLSDHASQIWVDKEWRVDVTDEKGFILFVLDISTASSAATMSFPAMRAKTIS